MMVERQKATFTLTGRVKHRRDVFSILGPEYVTSPISIYGCAGTVRRQSLCCLVTFWDVWLYFSCRRRETESTDRGTFRMLAPRESMLQRDHQRLGFRDLLLLTPTLLARWMPALPRFPGYGKGCRGLSFKLWIASASVSLHCQTCPRAACQGTLVSREHHDPSAPAGRFPGFTEEVRVFINCSKHLPYQISLQIAL